MSKVSSILDHPNHPSNKSRHVDSVPMTPGELAKQMRDFLDSAYTAGASRYAKATFDPFSDSSWGTGPHDKPDKLYDIIARPIDDDE